MILSALNNIDPKEGSILLIDKPLRWTSFDVINKLNYEIRKLTGEKKIKIGHAGTLDPLATGLLIVCIGKYTKKISEFQNFDKYYIGTFLLGAITDSYDLEHPPKDFRSIEFVTSDKILEACKQFIGNILQTPPIYSAVKIQGKSAFEYARQNKDIELKAKEISIYSFQITRFALPEIDFEIKCSKGTYIRSIARDLGNTLGCGAYLKALRRTQIGDFSVEDALDISPLFSDIKKEKPYIKKKKFEL